MAYALTPMMQQYMVLKEQYKDCFLFYRLGDFYEMFFDDAKEGSRLLELTLTGRDCGLEERAPMCGVPYHSVDVYINKLIEKGYKVALCEQMEDPALAKGLVERAVVRVITPGTVIEEKMLDSGSNHYIFSAYIDHETAGYAYCDISTGTFYVGELSGNVIASQLFDTLERISPTEVIINESAMQDACISRRLSSAFFAEKQPDVVFRKQSAEARLLRHFCVVSLKSFGCEDMTQAISAAGALMRYLEDTQKNALSHIHTIKTEHSGSFMQLDVSTRKNLELTQPLHANGNKKNTILGLLNCTKTAMGGRMLHSWVDCPLQNVDAIRERQQAIEQFFDRVQLRRRIQEHLDAIYDIERLCSKIAYGTINPRDCIALSGSLKQIVPISMLLSDLSGSLLRHIFTGLDKMEDVIDLIDVAISPDAPALTKDGGYIRLGYNSEVDEYRNIERSAKDWLEELQQREREATGIKNLRIGYNRVFGYYIEVTKSFTTQVPYHYERRQTLANAERYVTPELRELEQKILHASESLTELEAHLYAQIKEALLQVTERLQNNANLLASLDCCQSLAEVAKTNRYVMPNITTDGVIRIKNGRHPIVERSLGASFISNDVLLDRDENRLLIITGPNMAGKSTYMRQIALIALLAHIGSFVPADEASVCLVDRIFTRIGASDDLSAGQSTFMVEMSEMANILNNATADSLLILDEIGRGTSTFDGLSIAWSVLEHIANLDLCGAKTLFATHYHELTELEGVLSGVKNYRISVKEIGDDILFLRKIVRGSGDKSFGIQVARLAGLPASVVDNAKKILSELEKADVARPDRKPKDVDPDRAEMQSVVSAVCEELKALELSALSPIEALNLLYRWQHDYTDKGE